MEHEIGLHFDVTAYGIDLPLIEIRKAIIREIQVLERILDIRIKSISWHIPRRDLLGLHLDFLEEMGIRNAYDPYFYCGYKYVSDSMMRWREPVQEYIEEKKYPKLQILTHPIWYKNVQDMTDDEILDQSRDTKFDTIGEYLNTIKPGYYTDFSFSVNKIPSVCKR